MSIYRLRFLKGEINLGFSENARHGVFFSVSFAFLLFLGCTASCADWKTELRTGPRRINAGRVRIYSRAQFKYNAQLNYIGRWVDTPLLLDPELTDPIATWKRLSCATFAKMQRNVMKYGLDGFACLVGKGGTQPLYDYCAKTKTSGFTLLPEIAGSSFGGVKSYMYTAQRAKDIIIPAIKSPYAVRLNGRLVVSSYGGDAQTAEFYKKYFAGYKKEYGEDIVFLPHIGRAGGKKSWNKWRRDYHAGLITPSDVEKVKEYYRNYLRCCGGLYLPATALNIIGERTFDVDFERNFVVKLGKEVMREPEFKDCCFALTARVGHENCTRIGYRLSCQGTQTLRESMETALEGQPDFIIIPEWDGENENSSLRPTVCNSFAH
ncbi:MAG: hypothetical protein KAG97_09325, partial [Victivallales bacterium]|nr:hypothetical protein [Victivallales bacterium]